MVAHFVSAQAVSLDAVMLALLSLIWAHADTLAEVCRWGRRAFGNTRDHRPLLCRRCEAIQ